MPGKEHLSLAKKASGFTNARQVIARDIIELKKMFGASSQWAQMHGMHIPNSALQELIQLNISMFGL